MWSTHNLVLKIKCRIKEWDWFFIFLIFIKNYYFDDPAKDGFRDLGFRKYDLSIQTVYKGCLL